MKKYHVSGAVIGALAMLIGLFHLQDSRSATTIAQVVLGGPLLAASIWWYRNSKD